MCSEKIKDIKNIEQDFHFVARGGTRGGGGGGQKFNFLCVFGQIKDIKQIEQDFHFVARGGTWGSKI